MIKLNRSRPKRFLRLVGAGREMIGANNVGGALARLPPTSSPRNATVAFA